jgi:choline dehydrogenase-like flavoprotein
MINIKPAEAINSKYDLIFIGSGFGSLFYLWGALKASSPNTKILILEKGSYLSHADQINKMQNSNIPPLSIIEIPNGHKQWNFTIGLGGGTNCWWAQTPRMMPEDFELYTRYQVGHDWPISYTDIEPFYCLAERIMLLAGADNPLFPRSMPYPLPPHLPSTPDRIMMKHDPVHHTIMPTARASINTKNRAQCCATARCNLCPVDAKFTALNGMADILSDPRVHILCEADVKALHTEANNAASAVVEVKGSYKEIRADFFVLGANAIFTPTILKRSNIKHSLLGKGINEQLGYGIEVYLDGMNNFDGSTATTGLNYSLYAGEHRREAGAALVYFENRWTNTGLRLEIGKWRQTLPIVINVEDLLQSENYVEAPEDWDKKPIVHHQKHSEYAEKGLQRALRKLPELLSPLPVEDIKFLGKRGTESHIQGTTRMGTDPRTSIVDEKLIHHTYRNLAIVGTSVFPNCPPANPSLTAAALSLYASHKQFGGVI